MPRAESTLRPLTAIIVAITRLGIYTLRRGSARAPSSSPPTAFSHIILGQLLGIPSSSADVTGSIWAEVVEGDERGGSPGFGRSSAAISEIAAAAAFLSSQPAVGLLINVSFALNIRPCTPARPKPLLLSVVAGPQKEGSSRNWLLQLLFASSFMRAVSYLPSANRLSVLDKFKLSLSRLMM